MNRIERDIFKIITGYTHDYASTHFDSIEVNEYIKQAQLLAKKFEEGIREAFLQGCISNKLELTDYLKSIKE